MTTKINLQEDTKLTFQLYISNSENETPVKRKTDLALYIINVREYRRNNKNWTIKGNWVHRVHKMKTSKT